jgi:FtsP/CotA-like multicopper oxidase with cupredoxin domain
MKRRQFFRTAATFAGMAALPTSPKLFGVSEAKASPLPIKLEVITRSIDVDGKAAKVFGLVGPDMKHGFTLVENLNYEVELKNNLAEETMIHWHGLTPKWEMDGVPGMPMPMLKAGETRTFLLPSGASGTHWMHAHTLQEQALLAAPLIVSPSRKRDEQNVVILLHDFSFKSPDELLAGLKSGTMGRMSHSMMQGMRGNGMQMQGMDHSKMRSTGSDMMGMDLNDIEYDAYLANDRTLNDPEVVQVEKGGIVRLHIINGATATGFSIDAGQLSGTVVAVDGQDVVPIPMRLFPLAMGQRVDILLNIPAEGGAFPVFALREGALERTGIIMATAGAAIGKMAPIGKTKGPILNLEMEGLLRAGSSLVERASDRLFNVMLSGNMGDYAWTMSSDTELIMKEGERIVIQMMNHSMMSHPMHLHGHHFQIVSLNGNALQGALRDTVLVPPMSTVGFAFDANNPGDGWAFHCHHLYHMASGMMSFVRYT